MRHGACLGGWYAAALALLNLTACAEGGEPVAWTDTVKPGRAVWIRVLRIDKAAWLSVRTVFEKGKPSRLVLAQSVDRCRNWTDLASVAEPMRNLDNGLLFQVPDGSLLLACRSVAVNRSSGRLLVFRGNRDGTRWVRHGTIDSSDVAPGQIFGRGLWEPWLYLLPDAGWRQPTRTRSTRAKRLPSARSARSRSLPMAEPPGARNDYWRPSRAEASSGPVCPWSSGSRTGDLACTRLWELAGAPVYAKESDDGLYWPGGLGRSVAGHQSGPYVLELAGGRLLLTSCTNRISWSDDDGRTWTMAQARGWTAERFPDRTRLTWPALYHLGEGELMLSTSSLGSRSFD